MSTVRSICPTCGHAHHWSWEEAFDKFGFGDGDDLVMTETVAEALRRHGYAVETVLWGFHNTIVTEITREGVTCMPNDVTRGYDEPRQYLPQEVIDLLDEAFPSGAEVQP